MEMRKTIADRAIGFLIVLDVAPQDLWALLTEDAHLALWWGSHVTMEAVEGGSFRETWNDGERKVVTAGKILAADRPQHLSMTWADDDWPAVTTPALDISAQPSSASRLKLTHQGWEIHALPGRKRPRSTAPFHGSELGLTKCNRRFSWGRQATAISLAECPSFPFPESLSSAHSIRGRDGRYPNSAC
jgi:uncharacterized protein YndB with AHSA1/START domain